MFGLDRKKLMIIGIVLLVIILSIFLIIFSRKAKKEEKEMDKKFNYTLVYKKYEDKELVQQFKFVYKDNKLNDVYLTMYFTDKSIIDIVVDEYKSGGEYADVTSKGNAVTIKYKAPDMAEYVNLTKDDLTTYLGSQGYKLSK